MTGLTRTVKQAAAAGPSRRDVTVARDVMTTARVLTETQLSAALAIKPIVTR